MFSKNLRKLREFRNIDRKDLADILGLTYQAVSQYENGSRQPSFDTLVKISKYFGVTIDSLIIGNENFNTTKIKNLIKKLNYNFKEFAQDIGEPVNEIEKIALYDAEPSEEIINSICEKYSIPLSEFEAVSDKDFQSFCKAKDNREYIELSKFIKDNEFKTDYVKKLLKLIKSRDQQ